MREARANPARKAEESVLCCVTVVAERKRPRVWSLSGAIGRGTLRAIQVLLVLVAVENLSSQLKSVPLRYMSRDITAGKLRFQKSLVGSHLPDFLQETATTRSGISWRCPSEAGKDRSFST